MAIRTKASRFLPGAVWSCNVSRRTNSLSAASPFALWHFKQVRSPTFPQTSSAKKESTRKHSGPRWVTVFARPGASLVAGFRVEVLSACLSSLPQRPVAITIKITARQSRECAGLIMSSFLARDCFVPCAFYLKFVKLDHSLAISPAKRGNSAADPRPGGGCSGSNAKNVRRLP